MAELTPHSLDDACLEGELPGTCRADLEMVFDQTGLLGREPAVEEIVQPAERLLTGVAVQRVSHSISSAAARSKSSDPACLDVAAPGTGVGLFDQTTERRIDQRRVRGTVGVHQLLGVPIHLGATLGTA
jgi:hypothetical protein